MGRSPFELGAERRHICRDTARSMLVLIFDNAMQRNFASV
jgi:hypothetical protein